MKFICENCGKEFEAKPSSNRKYCSKKCSNEGRKGKPNPKLDKKVEVTCLNCGKVEKVPPCRAKKYTCCSVECLSEYRKNQHLTQVKCVCPICGKEFWVKPYRVKRIKTKICCSKECSSKLQQVTYLGENNHQYGLKGPLNASFKGNLLIKSDDYIYEYCPEHPKANRDGRVRQHRLIVERNYDKFDPNYFIHIGDLHILKDEYIVHHINKDKFDNRIENLQILTNKEHSKLHQLELKNIVNKYNQIIAVVKQGELLENLDIDNQQPSKISNDFKGSETNDQVLYKDSNIILSSLLQQIIKIVEDDIVRTTDIMNNETVELEETSKITK